MYTRIYVYSRLSSEYGEIRTYLHALSHITGFTQCSHGGWHMVFTQVQSCRLWSLAPVGRLCKADARVAMM